MSSQRIKFLDNSATLEKLDDLEKSRRSLKLAGEFGFLEDTLLGAAVVTV